MRIVVSGFIGLIQAGGVTWDYLQYVLGLRRLGHDVYYVEDTALWPLYQDDADGVVSCASNIAYLAGVMSSFGLDDRWAYRDEVSGRWFGMTDTAVDRLLRSADALVNVSCSMATRDVLSSIPLRLLIDSDPMFTQIQAVDSIAFSPGEPGMRATIAAHTHHFTFGENIGEPDCAVPGSGVSWIPTRQPICLWEWPATPLPSRSLRFTTVMNWAATREFEYAGVTWGQKDVEFRRVIELPSRVPFLTLEIAVTQSNRGASAFPQDRVTDAGWRICDPRKEAADWQQYRGYIQGSLGELSVAKEAYVKAKTGWFSCRSACYLASGRPVVTQDTGWTKTLPQGRGLFGFVDEDSAAEALSAVASDPQRHSGGAIEVAQEFFDSGKVLSAMLERAMH